MSLLVGVAQDVGRQHDDKADELDEQHAEEEDEEERTPMAHATTKVGRERLPIFAGSLHHVFHQDVHQGLDQDDDDDADNAERNDEGGQVAYEGLRFHALSYRHHANEQQHGDDEYEDGEEYAFQRAAHHGG